MNKNIPIVVITKMSPRWRPFQIFILGLYELERLGEIKLRFRCDWFYRISTILPDLPHLGGIMHQLAAYFLNDSYTMEGYVEKEGKRRTFCIDSDDSPHCYDGQLLDNVDIYFKTQCPKEIDIEKGFRLTDDVYLPYCDHRHVNPKLSLTARGERIPLPNLKQNIHKIRPSVVGFRRLADGNSYSALRNGFDSYRKGILQKANKKLMCYFGNAQGPIPMHDLHGPDYESDGFIMGAFPQLHHPNEKRAIIADIIGQLGEQYDARVISQQATNDKQAVKRTDLIIPIEDFCAHISNFQYNCNVSGLRMSMPNRFMESFIVGTAIVTDKLAVKWYLPFEEEVVELEEMGYLPKDSVNWNRVTQQIKALPEISKETVNKHFEEKWAPVPVARYLVKTVLDAAK